MKHFFLILSTILVFTYSNFVFAETKNGRPITQIQETVTVTNSAADIVDANGSGNDVFIQNNDASGIVYLNLSGTATTSGIKLAAGESINLINITNAISAIGSIASNANVVVIISR